MTTIKKATLPRDERGNDPNDHRDDPGYVGKIKAEPTPGAEAQVTLTPATAIARRPIHWLWSGWLARGKLHILAGAPGTGKTTISLALAAVISRGGQWPDGSVVAPGNVLIWSGEDDPSDTIVPRLYAAGADMSRIYIVGDVLSFGETRAFDPAADLAALQQAATRVGDISLLIADPVVSAVAGDSHKNTEVRRALQPVVNLATAMDCAVLGISHFSKGSGGKDPTERVTGSVAFGALARLVIVTAKGEDGGRLMARSKSNIGPDGGGFMYDLDQVVDGKIVASRVTWGDALEGTAKELLGTAEASDSPRDEAADWLADMLLAGPVPVKQIKAEANGAGMSWRTIERAKAELGAVAERVSDGATRGGGHWQWKLPINSATPKAASPALNSGGVEEPGNRAGSRGVKTPRPPTSESGGLVTPLTSKCPRCAGEGCGHCKAEGWT